MNLFVYVRLLQATALHYVTALQTSVPVLEGSTLEASNRSTVQSPSSMVLDSAGESALLPRRSLEGSTAHLTAIRVLNVSALSVGATVRYRLPASRASHVVASPKVATSRRRIAAAAGQVGPHSGISPMRVEGLLPTAWQSLARHLSSGHVPDHSLEDKAGATRLAVLLWILLAFMIIAACMAQLSWGRLGGCNFLSPDQKASPAGTALPEPHLIAKQFPTQHWDPAGDVLCEDTVVRDRTGLQLLLEGELHTYQQNSTLEVRGVTDTADNSISTDLAFNIVISELENANGGMTLDCPSLKSSLAFVDTANAVSPQGEPP